MIVIDDVAEMTKEMWDHLGKVTGEIAMEGGKIMDVAEKMAADIAMKMNGGEWTDGKWYSQGHRDAWVKTVQPYADEIEQLREVSQQQLDAAYRNGYDSAYAMGYSEGLKETLYDGMPRRDDRGDSLDGN